VPDVPAAPLVPDVPLPPLIAYDAEIALSAHEAVASPVPPLRANDAVIANEAVGILFVTLTALSVIGICINIFNPKLLETQIPLLRFGKREVYMEYHRI
jgi:hypothetical protein